MRVWFIHQYAVPADRPGGTRHFSVAKELVAAGHEVVLVAAGVHYQTGTETVEFGGVTERSEMFDGVEFIWMKTREYHGNSIGRLLNMLSFAWAVLRSRVLRQRSRPDVIVGSSPQPFAALVASLVAGRRGCPFVYEVRDLWPQTLLELGRMSAFNPVIIVFALIERWCARRATRTVTLLDHSAAHLVARGAAPDSVVCVPNGVDLRMVGESRLPPSRDDVVFMYAGAMGNANNLHTLIRAAALLDSDAQQPKIRLRLVGEGPEREGLQALAARIGVSNVTFTSAVSKDAVYDVLSEADCFVMILRDSPVFRWGISPNKLYDYMAMARPVLFAVNTPSNPVARAGAGVNADPNSARDLADGMIRLASMSRSERAELGRRGREYVEAHHDVRRLARRYAETLVASSALPSVRTA